MAEEEGTGMSKILLKLKNGGREELTMDEARELWTELNQIFGPKNVFPNYEPFDPLRIIGAPSDSPWPNRGYGPIIYGTDTTRELDSDGSSHNQET